MDMIPPIPTPHDRRRGSSQYRSAPGYEEANAIEDKLERERALDAVRQAALRNAKPDGVPSSHQAAAILADVVGLALADPAIKDAVKTVLGHHMRRAIRARGMDPKHPMTKRAMYLRMMPNPLVIEYEANERIRAEVAAARGRREETYESTLALLDSLRDDDEAH